MKPITIIGMFALILVFALQASAFKITSPEQTVYETGELDLIIQHNESVDYLFYSIDDGDEVLACESCSYINTLLNVTEGGHVVEARGVLGNDTLTYEVNFTVDYPDPDFSLEIISPEREEYEDEVFIHVRSNVTLDNLSRTLSGPDYYEVVCENCSEYNETIELADGVYTLHVKGVWGDIVKVANVSFAIDDDTAGHGADDDDDDDTGEDEEDDFPPSRFDIGWNKLPQLVEEGKITDEELAEILRTNLISPGITNRLIKTGKLGNRSVSAILETQFKPPGVLQKLLGWMGYAEPGYSGLIYEVYDLSSKNKQKVLVRDDLPGKYVEKVKEDVQEETQGNVKGKSYRKTVKVGKQKGKNKKD